MLFSQVLDSLALEDGAWAAAVPEDWLQGRSVFGGMQVALALRAMRSLVPAELPLRVIQTTFVGPVSAGTVRGRAHVLRTGKNTMHVEARIVENGQTSALLVGVFGRGRPSKAEVVARAPSFSPQEPIDFPFVPGLSASFAQHVTIRWLSGTPLLSGTTQPPHAVIEIGLDDRAPTNEGHVAAIADVIPPLALSMLTERAPGSSVTWTLEMLTDRFDGLPLKGWRVYADMRAGHEGYTSQSVLVCAPDGTPAALGHQTMVIFG